MRPAARPLLPQPFEPFLDWTSFALRLPESQVEQMHAALAAAEGPKLQQLQVRGVAGRLHARHSTRVLPCSAAGPPPWAQAASSNACWRCVLSECCTRVWWDVLWRLPHPVLNFLLQANLACAARHLYWAGTWGAIFAGDSGEFDAFNTLLAILRAKLRHPGVPAAQLRAVDAELARFMACQSPVRSTHQAPLCVRPNCERVQQPWPYGRQVRVGGAVCDGAPNLAACRRYTWGTESNREWN